MNLGDEEMEVVEEAEEFDMLNLSKTYAFSFLIVLLVLCLALWHLLCISNVVIFPCKRFPHS